MKLPPSLFAENVINDARYRRDYLRDWAVDPESDAFNDPAIRALIETLVRHVNDALRELHENMLETVTAKPPSLDDMTKEQILTAAEWLITKSAER